MAKKKHTAIEKERVKAAFIKVRNIFRKKLRDLRSTGTKKEISAMELKLATIDDIVTLYAAYDLIERGISALQAVIDAYEIGAKRFEASDNELYRTFPAIMRDTAQLIANELTEKSTTVADDYRFACGEKDSIGLTFDLDLFVANRITEKNSDETDSATVADDDYCFACGENNPIGLHLTFDFDGEKIFAQKILPREFEGYAGTVHGGIISTLLDETMCKFISAKYNQKSLTARLEVRFKFPTPINQEVKISAWQENQRKNIITMRSTVETTDGVITAEATAKFAVLSAS